MAQKDKVKELVGRGLDSYHTKALQQIDRIEKKNKEQNHKINILTNELDNDYLTKTEEGSVISLDYSKEGMIYIDSLEGNTLVNYCSDGSKELTLNGGIDVEGTSVTLTEGADDGKVDVMCEGNTLVNCITTKIEGNIKFIANGTPQGFNYSVIAKGSNVYTLVANIVKNTINSNLSLIGWHIDSNNQQYRIPKGFVGAYKQSFTTKNDIGSNWYIDFWQENTEGEIELNNFMLLEGDWTNKEVPNYFEGMKSVGQDDTTGHKIEILSRNKNLINCSKLAVKKAGVEYTYKDNMVYINGTSVNNYENSNYTSVENMKVGKTYTLSYATNNENKNIAYVVLSYYDNNLKRTMYQVRNATFIWEGHFSEPKAYIQIDNANSSFNNIWYKVQLEENSVATQYVTDSLNKKEILYYNPTTQTWENPILREWDSIEKHSDGKYYYHKRSGEVVLNGSEKWSNVTDNSTNGYRFCTSDLADGIFRGNLLCDKFKVIDTAIPGDSTHSTFILNTISISTYSTSLYVATQYDLEGFKAWLQANNVTVVYQLAQEEVYECTNLDLITYNDITHISNNSTIPCNMKIKNSGYNAIIKPSTLYTVALDTNKSGTIGINLGGTKVTTTNNVATITTPATLTDDSLRLYGKGIKSSKVRLLEGDKTNWIPSHFEGMKSSFEDKFDATDNTYKMEILSNNENLLDLTQHSIGTPYTNHYIIKNNSIIGIYEGDNYTDFQIWFNLKRNRTYKLSYSQESTYKLSENNSQLLTGRRSSYSGDCVLHQCYNGSAGIITNVPYDGWYTLHFHSLRNNNIIKDLQLKESNLPTDFVERKYNKIQFSSIEPLRSTKDISDRFVFKDGKIMIERNCIERDLTYFKFSTTEIKGLNLKGGITISDAYRQPQGGANTTIKCDKLASDFKEDTIPCINIYHHANQNELRVSIPQRLLKTIDKDGINDYFVNNPHKVIYRLAEPTYEEIPFELQKIILEGYENGTLFFDTNIPPTSTVTYAGETPIVKSVKLNKTEVLNNTNDINDNIVPYLMDMDYRVVCLQLQSENINDGVSMARLFGGAYEMLKRDILSKRLTREEYGYRLADYFNAGKLTEEQVRELEDLR